MNISSFNRFVLGKRKFSIISNCPNNSKNIKPRPFPLLNRTINLNQPSSSSSSSSSSSYSSSSSSSSILKQDHQFKPTVKFQETLSSISSQPRTRTIKRSEDEDEILRHELIDPVGAEERPILDSIDPFKLLSSELKKLRLNVVKLIETDQINLNRVSSYYFSSSTNGKMLRPLIVLLISKATSESASVSRKLSRDVDRPYSSSKVLNDLSLPIDPTLTDSIINQSSSSILPSQIRLAEITEMIHVASLLHDDVIDNADQRRGQSSSPIEFGNKLSILAGDYLLARSSVLLSRIGNHQVTELIATSIANLVQGELIQFDQAIVNQNKGLGEEEEGEEGEGVEEGGRFSGDDVLSSKDLESLMEDYLLKTYLKTGSLISKTARSAVILSHDPEVHKDLIESVYQFGKNLGLAFQIVDDILDYTGLDEMMGKPSNGSDLKLGLITAPTLYAWDEFPELGKLIRRRFKEPGDVELVQSIVKSSRAIPRSYELASKFVETSRSELLRSIRPSKFRDGLEVLCDLVLKRQR